MKLAEDIFISARELPDASARAAYLDETCGLDDGLRERVESMLRDADGADAFFGGAPETLGRAAADRLNEGPGTVIGRYTLLQKIGEGGMGAVYLAEQRDPVVRKVALKIIKLGMDTKSVVARFEAERQALALMDHPNIAKVLDAGATETGRPFFVMEWVQGLPITRFCEEANLSTRDRLRLFLEVCSAIEHAHQKGIIHRDIKPSNILVAMHGDHPVPRVIDFGIAKATQQRLTEKTIFTGFQQFLGTPAYMSPEQASLTGLDIDTRSDIYGLGVLLYELLTGRTPFDGKELLQSGLDEMRRTIREKEPPKPSTRVTQELAIIMRARSSPSLPALLRDQPYRRSSRASQMNASELSHLPKRAGGEGRGEEGRSVAEVAPHPNPLPAPASRSEGEELRHLSQIKQLIPLLQGDLDWVVMKAIEKDRSRRYETANGLAADIRRHLNNEPVVARPPSAVYRFQKAWRRNKPIFAAAMVVTLALLAGIAVSLWQSARRQRALVEARRTLYIAQMQAVQPAWEKGDIQVARTLLRAQIPRPGEEDLRGFEWRHFGKVCRDESLLTFTNEVPSGSKSVAISPDGSLLAWGDAYGRIQLCRTADWSLVNSFSAHRGGVFWLEFSRDGRLLVSGGGDRTATLWEVPSGAQRASFYLTNSQSLSATCVRLAPDAKLLAVGGLPGEAIHVWDLASREKVMTIYGPVGDLRRATFSPNGRHLAMNHGDATVRVWDLASKTEIRKLSGHRSVVGVVEYSPDGKWMASGEASGIIKLWETDAWREAGTLVGHRNVIMDLAFSPDGRTLASACRDGVIRIWDIETRAEIGTLRGHSGWVNRLAFFPNGRRLASTGDDQTLKIWDVPTVAAEAPTFQREPILHGDGSAYARFSPDGQFLATVGADRPARRLWRADSGQLIAALPGGWEGGAFSPDSRLFAAGGDGPEVHLWSASDGKEIARFPLETNHAAAVSFTPNGELLAAAEKGGVIHRWNLTSRQSLPSWTGYEGGIGELLVSPDGSLLAVWCGDGNIRIRDLATGKTLPSIPHASDRPIMDFSPNGKLLAVTSIFGTPRTQLWEARGARLIHAFEPTQFGLFGWCRPAFTADGGLLAIAGPKSKIEVWNVPRRKVVAGLSWTGGVPSSVAFTPDGRTLAICDNRGTIRLWSMKMFREVMVFSSQANFGGVRFSPNGNLLATQNIFRDNLLVKAASLAEVEAELAAEGNSHLRGFDPSPRPDRKR